MKRLALLLFALLFSGVLRAQFSFSLQSTNPVIATDLVTRDLQARAMKIDPRTMELVVLSFDNVVTWLDAVTLEHKRELPLAHDAVDLALSEDGALLFLASRTNRAIHVIRLSDSQSMDPISLGAETPIALESLPGSTNGFAALATNAFNDQVLRIFHNGEQLYTGSTYRDLGRNLTNIFAFSDIPYSGSYYFEFRLGDDGTLVTLRTENSGFFRPGRFANDGAGKYLFTISSAVFDTNRVYLLGGESDSRISSHDTLHNFAVPTPSLILTNVAGAPIDPVRWGSDGFAFIARGFVTTLRSTMAPRTQAADLSLEAIGFAGISGRQSTGQLIVRNAGPGAATDIRLFVQVPYPGRFDFAPLLEATASVGSIEKFNYGMGFGWRIPRLEPGQSVAATAAYDNPGVGTVNLFSSALHAEVDPTPDNTILLQPYHITLDPAQTDYVKQVTTTFWGGGLGGSIYLPSIDREIGVYITTVESLNLRTGLTTTAFSLDSKQPRIFANDQDPSTFYIVHDDVRLYSAETMQPLWAMPRGGFQRDPTRTNFDDMALLLFPNAVTNMVVSYRPPIFPQTTNALYLYVGTNEYGAKLEGGNQLFRTGTNTFLTYSGAFGNGKLQSIRIAGTNLVLESERTNVVAGREMDLKNNVIYSADGRTYDAATMQPLATFSGIQSPQSVRAYPEVNRAVFLMSRALAIYELTTRERLGTIQSTNFVWNYDHVPRSITFAPPDVLYLSSTTVPTIVRTSLLRGFEVRLLNQTQSAMDISFLAKTGRTYSIESTETLPSDSWYLESQIVGANHSVQHTINLGAGMRFFRVRQH